MALDLDQFFHEVELSLRVKSRPLEQPLIDGVENSVAHLAKFTRVKGVCNQFASRLVRRFCGRHEKQTGPNYFTKKVPGELMLREHLIVSLVEVLYVV